MSKLISQLKEQHAKLLAVFGEAKALGVDTPAGRDKLAKAKGDLLAHLRVEDVQLYPVLESMTAKEPYLKTMLELFSGEMKSVTAAVLDFFKKYESGAPGFNAAFEFARVAAILVDRIKKEENILYPEYLRLGLP